MFIINIQERKKQGNFTYTINYGLEVQLTSDTRGMVLHSPPPFFKLSVYIFIFNKKNSILTQFVK